MVEDESTWTLEDQKLVRFKNNFISYKLEPNKALLRFDSKLIVVKSLFDIDSFISLLVL